ncbi:hypothetical protein ACLOJK_022219 [Asimina triloba]
MEVALAKQEEKGENVEEIEEEQVVVEEDAETSVAGSEEMEMNIANVLQRIERFTLQPTAFLYHDAFVPMIDFVKVSELLEAGKAMFKDLSAEFEERMISIHREQIEKWQDQIKELRSLDALNEQASNRLRNAQYLLQNVQGESS